MILPPMVTTPPAATQNYLNWAGYEWNGGTGKVSVSAAEFVVPQFPFHKMNAAEKNNQSVMVLWTGLGVSPYIEQLGVYDFVDHGHVGWATFCTFWPTANTDCTHSLPPGTKRTGNTGGVSTGDKIFVKVQRNGLTYTMKMRDAGPHNVWSVSISKKLGHKDTTAEAIVEDTQYPGYAYHPLTYFSPVKFATSPSPSTRVNSPWAYAKKLTRLSIEVFHR